MQRRLCTNNPVNEIIRRFFIHVSNPHHHRRRWTGRRRLRARAGAAWLRRHAARSRRGHRRQSARRDHASVDLGDDRASWTDRSVYQGRAGGALFSVLGQADTTQDRPVRPRTVARRDALSVRRPDRAAQARAHGHRTVEDISGCRGAILDPSQRRHSGHRLRHGHCRRAKWNRNRFAAIG